MMWLATRMRRVLERSVLNPISWLAWAAAVFAAWGVCHALGWRADTAVLSGTVDPAHGSIQWVMMRGMLYAVTYFAAVVVAPVLVLASGAFMLLVRATRGKTVVQGLPVVGEPPKGGTTNGGTPNRQVVNSRDL